MGERGVQGDAGPDSRDLGSVARVSSAACANDGGKAACARPCISQRAPHPLRMRTVAYARVSSDSQDLATQRDAIGRLAAARGHEISEWYAEKASGKTTARPELARLRQDAKLNVGLGHMSVRDVRKADLEVWRNGLAGRPATINGVLSVVRAIFNDAVDNGVITLSPATRVKGLPPAHDESRKAFTADELVSVLEVVRTRHPAWWPMVATLLFLGARSGEVSAGQAGPQGP